MAVLESIKQLKPDYDIVVIGSGMGGLTAANKLGSLGYRVLILEQHYQLGGLSTWFKRRGKHIFDISLHGFPYGMKKTCRKYWSKEIADRIVQLHGIHFDNPHYSLKTTFTREDFTRLLIEEFKIEPAVVTDFFETVKNMNFYDDQTMTTRELFEKFFPGRNDVVRFLMEPITYANGSTLDEPAITYGIVFSNFMSKGVFIFQGGTDVMIDLMVKELTAHGVDIITKMQVDHIAVENKKITGVTALCRMGREKNTKIPIDCKSVVSNASLYNTILKMVAPQHFDSHFLEQTRAVRLNSSSCQVYIGIRLGETIPFIGDLLFTSADETFSSEQLVSMHSNNRTFSVYYPDTRPHLDPQYHIVASSNARYQDWVDLDPEHYKKEKERLIEDTLVCLEKYIPDIRSKISHIEAATPCTVERYTLHARGASFGTKFEGLRVSMDLPKQISGLFHAGSVGIIMSGWLGTANYGVIVSNEVDSYMQKNMMAVSGSCNDNNSSLNSSSIQEQGSAS